MVEKISVQIALEGTEEIKRQLADVSEAGQKCFADISDAAAKAGGFDKLDPTLIAKKFSQFGITATAEINKISDALQTATKAEALVTSTQKLEQGFNKVRESARSTHQAFRELGRVFDEVGLGPVGNLVGGLGRVHRGLGALGALVTAGIGLEKLMENAAATAEVLQRVAGITGQTVETVGALQQAYAAGGQSAQKFGDFQTKLALGMDEARKKASIDYWGKADEATVKWANDTNNLTQKFQQLAAGQSVTFSQYTTVQAQVEGLFNALRKAQEQGKDVNQVLADIIRTMTPLQRAQILPATGLGLTPEDIKFLQKGGENLRQQQQEAQKRGFILSPQELENLDKFNEGLKKTEVQIASIGAKWAAAFAGGLQQLTPEGFITGFINPIQEAFGKIGSGIVAALTSAFSSSAEAAGNTATAAGEIAGSTETAIDPAQRLATAYGQMADAAERAARAAASLSPAATPPSSSTEGLAGGGLIGGRGTGTSDSNLAWVSRGEFVMPARVVAQPGMLAFLETLRAGMRSFAMGGLVRGPIPAFAGGGLNAGMSHVTIQFPGLPPVTGLRASSAVIDELRRSAALAQVRSGGRKPSRYS